MSHKIQITVNSELNQHVKAKAQQLGLSVSSYARLALISVVEKDTSALLGIAIDDVKQGNIEKLILDQFDEQIDDQ